MDYEKVDEKNHLFFVENQYTFTLIGAKTNC